MNDEPSLSAAVSKIFSSEGPLARIPGFEKRPQQEEMARAIAAALEQEKHLILEAGTGVGKSLAYLIPALLASQQKGRKAIISTHTINLQEQLLYKDIPLLEKILGLSCEAVLLKGRQNYLCPVRLERALQHGNDLFSAELLPQLERLRLWSETTKDGTLSDLPEALDPQLWAQVCSERHLCTPKTCGKNPRCFYQAARRRALTAPILILNHPLFFTLLEDASENEKGFLFPNDFVIFDEAHTMEGIASRHLGITFSQYGLRQLLHRLYFPRTHKGLLQQAKATSAITAVAELLPEVDLFFEKIAALCHFQKGRDFRLREKDLGALKKIAKETTLPQRLQRLSVLVANAAETLENEATQSELNDLVSQLEEMEEALVTFLEQREPDSVYWVEKTGKSSSFYNLQVAPVSIDQHLQQLLFRKGNTAILTSATLSTGTPNLTYFRNRIGAAEVEALELGSPFDYQEQMKLHLVRTMPDPREERYEAELEKWISYFTELSEARAFVLFTSYKTMQAVAQKMQSFFDKKGWQLLVQGEALSRTRMLEAFRSGKPSVLFGTESFWTGVDIPGEALSNVIITRLPFATPDQPLIEAKLEQITRSGGNGFGDYSLPEAILKLRQGVGRLIRNKNDRGIVAILDSRMVHKAYGKSFLKALPACQVEVL
ncbi:MAG: DEAD/DEAH box helicase [Verrucomicrobia bacterium]|nr:DEAD/DEAH box helicase [Verrucomicrobiota bacterium]